MPSDTNRIRLTCKAECHMEIVVKTSEKGADEAVRIMAHEVGKGFKVFLWLAGSALLLLATAYLLSSGLQVLKLLVGIQP